MQRLMIADASDVVRKVGKRILSELGFLVSEAETMDEALERCGAEMPNVLIVDAGIEGAIELITSLRAQPEGKDLIIYYCVVEADLKKMMLGKRAGANEFLMKPFDRRILTAAFGKLAIAA